MTKAQAEKLAKQIFDKFGDQIRQAVKGTNIPAKFIAGLVANEAGRYKSGAINRDATRFEPHIYTKLKRVASTPGATFNGIRHGHLADATDAALKALAHSYEATQIMGYWVVILGCTIADLRDDDKHFYYTVQLLKLNGFPKNATEAQMDAEMRQWNTGRETGKTYHANYVPNARLIRAAYDELEKGYKPSSSAAASTAEGKADHPAGAAAGNPPQSGPANTIEPPPIETKVTETVAEDGAKETTVETTTFTPQNIPAFIPRFGKQWILSVIPGGGVIATVGGYIAGLPPWMVFALGMLTGCAAMWFGQLVFKHRMKVLDFINWCYQTMADPTQNNPIPTPAAGFVGQRKDTLENTLTPPEPPIADAPAGEPYV